MKRGVLWHLLTIFPKDVRTYGWRTAVYNATYIFRHWREVARRRVHHP